MERYEKGGVRVRNSYPEPQVGMRKMTGQYAQDTHTRSWVKSLSYRTIGTAITVVGIGVATGDWALAGSVGVIINLVKIFSYYLHERLWERVHWGRNIQEDK